MKAHTLRLYAYIDFKNGSAKIEVLEIENFLSNIYLTIKTLF